MEGLLPGERIDDLMRNGLKLIQQEDGFRFGTDSVLLADFAIYGRMERVADLGTGSGILPILMADACPGARVRCDRIGRRGGEPRPAFRGNERAGRAHSRALHGYARCGAKFGIWRVWCVRLPIRPMAKRAARWRARGRISAWRGMKARCPSRMFALAPRSCSKMAGGCRWCFPRRARTNCCAQWKVRAWRPKRMRLVESFAGKPPKLVLADAVKGGGSQMHWLPTLVLYEADGSPTLEYRKIYRM